MAFKLNLKFIETLNLPDVSRQSIVWASTIYSKTRLVLSRFRKWRAQQVVPSGVIMLNLNCTYSSIPNIFINVKSFLLIESVKPIVVIFYYC